MPEPVLTDERYLSYNQLCKYNLVYENIVSIESILKCVNLELVWSCRLFTVCETDRLMFDEYD